MAGFRPGPLPMWGRGQQRCGTNGTPERCVAVTRTARTTIVDSGKRRSVPGMLPAVRVRGACHFYLAVDLGFAVDLGSAERLLARDQIQQHFKKPRRAPEPSQLKRRSARVVQGGTPVAIGGFSTEATAEITLWEFGAATIGYRIALDEDFSALTTLSDQLWDNQDLLADARRRAQQLLAAIEPAVEKPSLGARFEDYVIFELHLPDGAQVNALWTTHAAVTASILRAEPEPLSQEEIDDALAMRCSYLPDEVVLIDWFAALLVGSDMDDERLVIELSVAELLELRHLDEQLDVAIDAAYDVFMRKRGWLASLRTRADDLGFVSQLQADAAVLFEGVDNALKLVGDQYLARLYRITSNRFRLPQWDDAIERKLSVLDGIYQKLETRSTSRRFELLEVVIVILIALSMVVPFLPELWPFG